jgi:O-antigen/teichoic acid export membrane protein
MSATGSLPIGVAGLLFVLLLRLDVTLLSFLSGEAEVGDYAAAYHLDVLPAGVRGRLPSR